jgi:O-antigen ligase
MALSLFKVELFFSIAAFMGYIYLGSDSSPLYIILMTGIGVLNIGLTLVAMMKSQAIKVRDLLLLIGFPLFVLISLIFGIIASRSAIAIQQRQFNSFLAFSLPNLFIGWYIAKKKVDIFNSVFLVMIIISAGSIASILVPFLSGRGFTVMGGASYQAASYYTAFAFGLNLYILEFKANHTFFKKINAPAVGIFQFILLLLQAVMVIIPGGRGAFVLMIAYIALSTSKVITERNIVKTILGAILFLIASLLLIRIFPRLYENSIFQRGFDRAIAFIGPGGTLDWEGSSGRLPIYLESIELFKQSPVYGYGLYGYLAKVSYGGYPHNFFLEILLQGGLLYLSVWIVFIWNLFRKLYFNIQKDERNRIFLYLGAYPAVMLMFSGSYLTTGLLWFVVAYIVFGEKYASCYRIKL